MSTYTPKNLEKFRTAVARVRNMPEFKTIIAYLEERKATNQSALVQINKEDFPIVQGRAREVEDIIEQLTKE